MNCAVCGQPNASKHYGSVCCSGCKGFFRRTVREQRAFRCQFEHHCDVTKELRNCCRACRYAKCIAVGLDPRLVCSDRGPIARNRAKAEEIVIKAEEPVDFLPEFNDHDQPTTSSGHVPSAVTLRRRSSAKLALNLPNYIPTRDLDDLPLGAKRLIPLYDSRDTASVATYFISAERLCDFYGHPSREEDKYNVNVPAAVAFRRPGMICPRIPADWRPANTFTAKNFTRGYLRTIAHFFDWVSHVPELELLSEQDKELLMCHRSAIQDVDGVVLTGGEYMPPNEANIPDNEIRPVSRIIDIAMLELVMPLRRMSISEAEYALLHVLCLCSPVPRMSAEGAEIIRAANEKYLGMLSDIARKSLGEVNFNMLMNRISGLLTLLSGAERVAQINDATLTMMSMFNYAGFQGSLTWDLHVKKNTS